MVTNAKLEGILSQRIFVNYSRLNLGKYFINRVVQKWNNPPDEVVQAPTISVFWQSWPRRLLVRNRIWTLKSLYSLTIIIFHNLLINNMCDWHSTVSNVTLHILQCSCCSVLLTLTKCSFQFRNLTTYLD